MAFKLSPEAQSVFYQKVFGSNHPVTQMVGELLALGVVFEASLYTCKAIFQGKAYQVSLTKGTTSLMKGKVDPVFAAQNKTAIAEWVGQLHGKLVKPVPPPAPPVSSEAEVIVGIEGLTGNILLVIKAIREITGCGLKPAKDMAEAAQKGLPTVIAKLSPVDAAQAQQKLQKAGAVAYLSDEAGVKISVKQSASTATTGGMASAYSEADTSSSTVPPIKTVVVPAAKAKPVPSVIHLKDSKALGQKVHGTSAGSVYHCVALNDRVKVAARILKGGSISIRAEWEGAMPDELKKLQDAGLGMKSNYASMHLSADNVPFGRVIGAFVVGTGIKWTEAVTSAEDLVVSE